MSDQIEVEVEAAAAQKPLFSDEETEIFVEEGSEASEGDSQALINELREKQASLQAQVDPMKAMKSAVESLGASLKPVEAKPDVSVRANINVPDWNAYKESFNTKVFEDPFGTITDLVQKSAEMSAATVANQNLAYSKRIVMIAPETKDLYKRFEDEIEREVSRMPVSVRASDPNVYENALTMVKAKHFEELMEERLADERKKVSGAKPEARKAAFSETASRAVGDATTPATKIKVSSAKAREIEKYAEDWGIPNEAAVRLFKNRGWLG